MNPNRVWYLLFAYAFLGASSTLAQHPEPWYVTIQTSGVTEVMADRQLMDDSGRAGGCCVKLIAVVRDASGNLVPNAAISFAPILPHPGNVAFANGLDIYAPLVTDASGTATAYAASSTSGSAVVRATVTGPSETCQSPNGATVYFIQGDWSVSFHESSGSGGGILNWGEQEGTVATILINGDWIGRGTVKDLTGAQYAEAQSTAYVPLDKAFTASSTCSASVTAQYTVSWASTDGWSTAPPVGFQFQGWADASAIANHANCSGTSSATAESTSLYLNCNGNDSGSSCRANIDTKQSPGTVSVTVTSQASTGSTGGAGGSGSVGSAGEAIDSASVWQHHSHYQDPEP